MRYLIEIYREQRAQIEIDTDEYPDETEGWDALDEKKLALVQEAAAFELVEFVDWEDEDSGVNFVRIVEGDGAP